MTDATPEPSSVDEEPTSPTPGPPPGVEPAGAPYRLALRALAFCLLFVAATFALDPLVMRQPFLRRLVLLENAFDMRRIDRSGEKLLYLGDSVVGWGGDKEGREQVLPALAASASGLEVVDGSHPAYGPRCYLAQLAYLRRAPARPRLILLQLSLASFGPRRAENPSWHFGLRRATLESERYLPRRALAVFEHGFGARSQASYEELAVVVEGERVASVGQLVPHPPEDADAARLEESLRLRLLGDYATPIEESPEWSAAGQLFASLASLEVPSVLYLTAYDHEATARLLTPPQRARIRANARALVELARAKGVTLHDLSETLPSAAIDAPPGVTTEHLFPSGRVEVIRRLEPAIRAALEATPR